jgi:hypothetical protein
MRIFALDHTRGLAVILAMASHTLMHLGVAGDILPLKLITRTATPTFIVLFGIMLELVYARKWREGRVETVSARFVERAILCYFVFMLTGLAALVTAKIGFDRFFDSITYIGGGRFGNILKNYSVLFAFAPVFMFVYVRLGIGAVLLLSAAGWALKVAEGMIVVIPDHYVLSFFIGTGTRYGPSLLHGLTLVTVGLLIGRFFVGGRLWPAVIAYVVAFSCLVIAVFEHGAVMLFYKLVSYETRASNLPIYYAFGTVTASSSIAFFYILERLRISIPRTMPLLTLGQHSLFAYGAGNILLNLAPRYDDFSTLECFGVMAGFLVGLTLLTIDYTKGPNSVLNRITFGGLWWIMKAHSEKFRWLGESTAKAFTRLSKG